MLVDPGALVPQVIGADDRRIAPGIAEADRAFFEHRDIPDPVLLGEIIAGRQTMPATADDDHPVMRPRRRFAPQRRPAAMLPERSARQRGHRIALHSGTLPSAAATAKF